MKLSSRPRLQGGFTLLELMIVMIGVTACASLSVTVLLGVMQHHTATTNQIRVVTALSRLESQFREDVHAAIDAEVADDRVKLETDNGRQIEYALEADDVLQRKLRTAAGDVRVDRIDLGSPCALKVEASMLDNAKLLSLVIVTKPIDRMNDSRQALAAPPRDARFTAELGRDFRWSRVK